MYILYHLFYLTLTNAIDTGHHTTNHSSNYPVNSKSYTCLRSCLSDPAWRSPHLMLRTRLFPLRAQGNEELVCLQVDADTGNLRLLDMLLNLELFLCLAIDRWTACVTH